MNTTKALKLATNELLAIALGVGLGFLCLEIIGVPLIIAVLLIGRYASDHSDADLTLPLLGFGVAFACTVGWFTVRTSGIFDGTGGSGIAYFAFWFLVGCALTVLGVTRLAQRPAEKARVTSPGRPPWS
jgi:hypothetical protein